MRLNLIILILLSFVVVQFSFGQSTGTDSLTVDQAVKLVLERYPSLDQARAAVSTAEARVSESESSLSPIADADLSYTRLDPVPSLEFPGLGNFMLYPNNNYDIHAGVRDNIYDFGKRDAQIDVAKSNVQVATDNIDVVKSKLAYQTIQSFYAILFLQRSAVVQQQQIDALNEHLQITQKKIQAGTAIDFDLLTTQVRIATAKNVLIGIQNKQRHQEVMLRQLLAYPAGTALSLKGEFSLTSVGINVDSLTAVALEKRIELKSSKDEEQTAQLQKHLASLGDMPSVNLGVIYGVKNGYIPNLDAWHGNWIGAAEIKVPIFNGNQTKIHEQEADAALQGLQAHTRDLRQTISAEVSHAVEDIRSILEQLTNSELQVQQAEAAVANARIRYDNGVLTNIELLDAETDLSQAQLLNLESLYKFVINRYTLDKAIGTLRY